MGLNLEVKVNMCGLLLLFPGRLCINMILKGISFHGSLL